ncbi:hypothetical protein AB0D14_31915 [Streptomyces sp. NPDC048484]|uniref:5'-methylthioadenosine/S-adenosylhomocysteine nucleosidase family protein n=1 Tax=Streptomyces sp. NPDC048484 TaxID=3155146 RepID=UPI00342711E8
MTDDNSWLATPPDLLAEENPEQACRALAHILDTKRDVWRSTTRSGSAVGGNGQVKRSLLVADYARRSKQLPPELRAYLDRKVINSFLPPELAGVKEDADFRHTKEAVDVAVVTVLPEELDATLSVFGLNGEVFRSAGGQRFYPTRVPARRSRESLSVIITASGEPYNIHIVRCIQALLEQYAPKVVFLLGIAAGVPGQVQRGDVVVARRVHYYESARLGAVVEPRPQYAQDSDTYGYGIFHYNPNRTNYHDEVNRFLRGLNSDDLPEGLEIGHRPHIVKDNATITSGEKVLRDGNFLRRLRDNDNAICAADQESYGFARTVHDLPWLIFRGISDHGDDVKDDRWKYVASTFAALCLKDFLQTQYLAPGTDTL